MSFINDIKSELSKSGLQKWHIQKLSTERKEFYYIQKNSEAHVDQMRSVFNEQYYVSLSVKKDNTRIGTARAPIHAFKNLKQSIQELIEKAKLSDEKDWNYGPVVENNSEFISCYTSFERDFELGAQILADKLRAQIANHKNEVFNSAELFLSKELQEDIFSNGLTTDRKRSKIYCEVCFSSDDGPEAQEYLLYRMGAHPEQINFETLIKDSINYSKKLKEAKLPPAGKYQVMIDAEVIGQLMYDSLTHLDSSQKYYKMPFREKAAAYIDDYQGQSFQLILNPASDYLFGSRRYNSQAQALKATRIVEDNKILENITTPQMSQYLGVPEAAAYANIQLVTEGEDVTKWSQKEPVLEVLQFSGLFSNSRDLSFSSEIRLGRIWYPGQEEPVYVKGGSLSGKFQENFRKLRFSRQNVSLNLNEESLGYSVGYSGPDKALLTEVTISS